MEPMKKTKGTETVQKQNEDGNFMLRSAKQSQDGLAIDVAFFVTARKRAFVRDKRGLDFHSFLDEGRKHFVAIFGSVFSGRKGGQG